MRAAALARHAELALGGCAERRALEQWSEMSAEARLRTLDTQRRTAAAEQYAAQTSTLRALYAWAGRTIDMALPQEQATPFADAHSFAMMTPHQQVAGSALAESTSPSPAAALRRETVRRRVQLLDPLKAKSLVKGLQELSEEGAAQFFRPLEGSGYIIGALGSLQFDVIAIPTVFL